MKISDKLVHDFISIYSIPVKENWEIYLKADHMNYFAYMVHSKITAHLSSFNIADPGTYKFSDNMGLRSFLAEKVHYFDINNLKGKVVIDVGCGWGFFSFWLLLNGVKEVVAIGFPYQIEFINRLLKAAASQNLVPKDGKITCIEKPLVKGNTDLGNLGYNYADQVMYIDVFEHIPDDIFDDALKATYNTLKPGGKLISSCHNTDNPTVMKKIKWGWDNLEDTQFIEFRKKKIQEKISSIIQSDLELMAVNTRGMMQLEFDHAIAAYQKSGTIPALNAKRPAVDLSYDYICENYISPSKVLNKMKQTGFKSAYCFPALRHSRRYMPFWPVDKLLGPVLMKSDLLSATAVFVGQKPE